MTFLSPTFWLAILVYGIVMASSGAVVMEKIKNGQIASERLEVAQVALHQSENATRVGQDTQARDAKLSADLAAEHQLRIAAEGKLKGSVHGLVSPSSDARTVVPFGFVWLWNVPIASGPGGKVSDTAVAEPAPGSAERPSGVALSTVAGAVVDAKTALAECQAQVIGWRTFWSTVVTPWYTDLLKGLT